MFFCLALMLAWIIFSLLPEVENAIKQHLLALLGFII
jgi:hypothetical protein